MTELEPVGDQIAGQVDAELADALALLPTWRMKDEVRKTLLRLDPDVATQRVAAKNADRGVSLHPDTDDQAVVSLVGPAVPLTRWYSTVDARARALKSAGDPRPLDALRFDLATSTYPCDTHRPADPTSPAAGLGIGADSGTTDDSEAKLNAAPWPTPSRGGLARARLRS